MNRVIKRLVIFCQVFFCAGCMVLDPGGQAARSLDQKFTVLWNENGTLEVLTEGPHAAAWEVAGGDLVLTTDENGKIVIDPVASELNYWLRYYPSADAAATVAPTFAEGSIAQTRLLAELLMAVVPYARGPPTPPADGPVVPRNP